MISTQDIERLHTGLGLYSIVAEIYTDHWIIGGELSGPEPRLSDQLNSSASHIDIRPIQIRDVLGNCSQGARAHAQMTKAKILFVIPITEPNRSASEQRAVWRPTITQECGVRVGPYNLKGKVHVPSGDEPRLTLRSLDRQFVPFTDASLSRADGTHMVLSTVIVNRHALDLFTFDGR